MTIGELRTFTLLKFIRDNAYAFEFVKELKDYKELYDKDGEVSAYIVVPIFKEKVVEVKTETTKVPTKPKYKHKDVNKQLDEVFNKKKKTNKVLKKKGKSNGKNLGK